MADLRRDRTDMSVGSVLRGKYTRNQRKSSLTESLRHSPRKESNQFSRSSSVTESIQSRPCHCSKCDVCSLDSLQPKMQWQDEDMICSADAAGDTIVEPASMKTPRFTKLELIFDELKKDEPPEIDVKELRNMETTKLYKSACEILHLPVVAKFVSQINNVTVSLSNFQLNASELKPIVISLVRDSRITFLDLSYNKFGADGTKYIAEMLQVNSNLACLNLTGTEPRGDGLKALSECLPLNRTLHTLHLSAYGPSLERARSIRNSLDNKIDRSQIPYVADIIQRCTHIKELRLDRNQLGYDGGKVLGKAISSNQNLKTLDLQWNHFRRESAMEICRAIEVNKCLRRLNLGWNGFAKEGCHALSTSLPRNKTLKELDLTSNRIDLQALALLMKGVVENKGLEALRLGHNPMTTDGARAILGLLQESSSSQIKELDLYGIPIDSRFNERLSELLSNREIQVNLDSEIKRKGTRTERKEHDATNLSRFDPVTVLFEYMKMDNMRVMDLFSILDKDSENRLTRRNIAEGVKTLKLPLTEHAIDQMLTTMDTNKDGIVEVEDFINAHRQTIRRVTQRTIRAKALNKEDGGLVGMRKAIALVLEKKKAGFAEVRTTKVGSTDSPSFPGSPRKLPAIGAKQVAAS